MKTAVLCFGKVDRDLVGRVKEDLVTIFEEPEFVMVDADLPVPAEAFDQERRQYGSRLFLESIRDFAEKNGFDRALGIVDLDLFTSGLNFIFGQADSPGKAAVISLWRLRPEFYGKRPDDEVFVERIIKEAVHELGHTLGLKHCDNPYCVMYFSNSIFETDRKRSLFCNKCYARIQQSTYDSGKTV